MATLYFVNGGLNNNWTQTGAQSNWSLTDGGAGGQPIPTSSDDVVFTGNSPNCIVSGASVCRTLAFTTPTTTNYTNTITMSSSITVGLVGSAFSGDVTLPSSFTDSNVAGSGSLIFNVSGSSPDLTSNGGIWNAGIRVGGGLTITFVDNWTINELSTITSSCTLQTGTINIRGDFIISHAVTGSSLLRFIGTGNQNWNHTAVVNLSNSVTVNKPSGILTLSTNIYYQTGTFTYIASGGTVNASTSTLNIGASTTLNTNGINWNNVTTSGTTTLTLSSNFNITNLTVNSGCNLSFSGTGLSISGNLTMGGAGNGASTFNVPNNLTITNFSTFFQAATNNYTLNGNTISITGNITVNMNNNNGVLGNTTLKMVGTGNLTFSNSSNTNFISNPFTIDTAGTITTVGSGTPLFSSSTITYTLGTITGVGVIFSACTLNLNSGGKWGTNVNIRGNTTLTSNATFGNLTTSTNNVGLTGAFTINVEGNLAINIATGGASTPIVLNGTGAQSWTHGSAVYLTSNLTINKASGTLTIGSLALPNVYYNTGTLTYNNIGGIVDAITNNSTLTINASCTLNTNGITWNNFTILGTNPTITLSSNINITGTLTFALTAGTLNFTTGGNLFNATGDLSLVSGTINLPNDLYVVNATLGVTTANPTINLNTIYISGNLTTTSSGDCLGTTNVVLSGTGTWSNSSTGIITNNLTIDTLGTITISGIVRYGARTLTHLSGNVITDNSTLYLGFPSATGTEINTPNVTWFNLVITGSTTTTTLLDNVYVQNVLSFEFSGANLVNGYSIYTSGFNYIGFGLHTGTTFIIFNGNGTWRNNTLRNISLRIIIDCTSLELIGNPYFNGSSITYLKGKIKSDYGTINFNGNSTVNNFNKIVLNNVLITAGVTLTMNEFFCGTPELQTSISSTSTTNYIISFTDNFEKIAKFVNITNCTLTRPQQLIMLTNTKKSTTNARGIRYNNQSPNGIAKGDPSVQNLQTVGQTRSLLIGDPSFSKTI